MDPPAAQPDAPDRPRVDPHLYLHPQTLARLGSFELRAKMIVEGVTAGQHRSPYAGVSIEFAQHRPYTPGDDLRHLDWKVYARTDRLQVKQYQQETNLDLVVLVDSSGSMRYGSRPFAEASGVAQPDAPRGQHTWSKFDHATALTAALAYITIHQGDRVGLAIYADGVRANLSRTSSRGAWRQIVDLLATHPVDQVADITRVMDQAIAKLSNRCLIAVASDLYADPEDLRTALARAKHRGHDVILFQTIDQAEETFRFDDPAPFVGLEGEPTLRIDPRALRRDYLAAFNAHNNRVEKIARSFGFDYQRISTHDWLGPSLSAFVARRNALLKRRSLG